MFRAGRQERGRRAAVDGLREQRPFPVRRRPRPEGERLAVGPPQRPPRRSVDRQLATLAAREVVEPDVVRHIRHVHGESSAVGRQIEQPVDLRGRPDVLLAAVAIDRGETTVRPLAAGHVGQHTVR